MNFTEHFTAPNPKLHFLDGPRSGPPLLLLHGVTRRAEDFHTLWDGLAHCNHIIAIDQRGHGNSERASGYLITDYVADAVRFVRDDLAAPVVILGHSLGAMVAAGVAAELPEQVRGIVLEDPPFHTMGRNIHGTPWESQFIGMRDAALRGGSVEQLTDLLGDIRVPQIGGGFKRLNELRDRASLQWSAHCLSHVDPHLLTPIIEGRWLDGYDIPGILSRIRCPVLLMQADPQAGGALTDADVQFCVNAVAKCQVERFPGDGHLLHWQQPGRIVKIVNEFMHEP